MTTGAEFQRTPRRANNSLILDHLAKASETMPVTSGRIIPAVARTPLKLNGLNVGIPPVQFSFAQPNAQDRPTIQGLTLPQSVRTPYVPQQNPNVFSLSDRDVGGIGETPPQGYSTRTTMVTIPVPGGGVQLCAADVNRRALLIGAASTLGGSQSYATQPISFGQGLLANTGNLSFNWKEHNGLCTCAWFAQAGSGCVICVIESYENAYKGISLPIER